jgi:hypothetical protein
VHVTRIYTYLHTCMHLYLHDKRHIHITTYIRTYDREWTVSCDGEFYSRACGIVPKQIHTHAHTHTHTSTHTYENRYLHMHLLTTGSGQCLVMASSTAEHTELSRNVRQRRVVSELSGVMCVYKCVYVYMHVCMCVYLLCK